MTKWLSGLVVFLLVVPALQAQQIGSALDQHQLGLKDIIKLQEQTDTGKLLGLRLGVPPQDVDVNSVIKIQVSAQQLRSAIAKGGQSQIPLSPQHQELLKAVDKLQGAVDILSTGLRKATELQQMVVAGERASAAFASKAQALQQYYKSATKGVREYLNFLAHSPDPLYRKRATTILKQLNTLALKVKPVDWNRLIAGEVNWVSAQLEQAAEQVIQQANPVALSLSAYSEVGGSKAPVHLEHYDDLPPGTPQPVDKLNVVPSPEEVAKLKEMYAKAQELSDKLNEVKDSRDALKGVLDVALTRANIDLSELNNAVAAFQQELAKLQATDWSEKLTTAGDRIKDALAANITPQQKQTLEAVQAQVNKVKQELKTLQSAVATVQQQVTSLSPRLDQAALLEKNNPVDALVALLGQVAGAVDAFKQVIQVIKNLSGNIQTFAQAFKQLFQDVAALKEALASLDAGMVVKNEIKAVTDEFADQAVSPVQAALNRVTAAARQVGDALSNKLSGDTKNHFNEYAASAITPPDTSRLLPLTHVKDTWLDLRTIAKRTDGSIVTLRATLYRVKADTRNPDNYLVTNTIDSEIQQFRLLRFGAYGSYSVGLAYISTEDVITGQTERSRGFAPQVSWILHYRSWREQDAPAFYTRKWYERFGIGLHTVALDLNKDNENEIGFGVTISAVDDLLQIGYGRDLSLGENYYFLATRLFKF